jgi:hypothetical protein
MTLDRFKQVVAGLDETVIQEAVGQAREDGLNFELFCLVLGTHASGISEVVLRRGYAAALLDEKVSGVTPRQAQAIHDALLADPELKWGSPQDGCHARGVLMVEAMLHMGVSSSDVGKLYAFHREHARGSGWQVTTRDGQSVSFREHVGPTILDRNGEPLVLDPTLVTAPTEADAWVNRLGAPDFQHAPAMVAYALGMLPRMNSGNVDAILTGIERLNPAAYHYLISAPAARDQLQQLGATLPAAPELGWVRLEGTQAKGSRSFFRDLGQQYRTGAIIQVGFGQRPFTDTPFDLAAHAVTGVAKAREYLTQLP